MCCAPVSGHEVGRVFQSEESRQDRSPKESSGGSRVDKVRLGRDDLYYLMGIFRHMTTCHLGLLS